MSRRDLSDDTEVVLLLCGRFGGEKQDPYQPLSPREYGELAKWLKARELRPSHLLTDAGRDALQTIQEARLERKRVEFLLERGTAMALALERWARGGLWVISRGDPEYPSRLKQRLKHAAPPLLYGAGDKALLEFGGLAIIGSRDATPTALEYTRSVAAKCAKEGLAVVSGGARGVDSAAMQGVTAAEGNCIGVLACDLLKSSLNRQNRIGLQEGRLVLVSPYFPEAGFNGGNAMGRNRYIYTLSDRALVIDSALRSGGTWEGAVENLKNGWVPLYVRTPGDGPGNAELVSKGGIPFILDAAAIGSLKETFSGETVDAAQDNAVTAEHQQSLLAPAPSPTSEDAADAPPALSAKDEPPLLTSREPVTPTPELATESAAPASVAPGATKLPALELEPELSKVEAPETAGTAEGLEGPVAADTLDMFADFCFKLSPLLKEGPLSEQDVSETLCIEKSQARAWLKRANENGLVEKLNKPVRYVLGRQGSLC